LWRQLNDRGGLSWLLTLQGTLAENNGDAIAAHAFFQQALELRQLSGSAPAVATSLFDMGRIEDAQEHYDRAYDFYQRSLSIRRGLGHHRALLDTLEAVAGVLPLAGQSTLNGATDAEERLQRARRAARVLGTTQVWRDSLSLARPHHIARLQQRAEARLRHILSIEFETHYAVGQGLTIEDAVRCLSSPNPPGH
jgi:tetratricopeptide (TPR) repeat protein